MLYPVYSEFGPVIAIDEIKAAGDLNHEFFRAMKAAGYNEIEELEVIAMPYAEIRGQCPDWMEHMYGFFLDGSLYITHMDEYISDVKGDCTPKRLFYRFTPVVPASSAHGVLVALEQAATLYLKAYKSGELSGKRIMAREIRESIRV